MIIFIYKKANFTIELTINDKSKFLHENRLIMFYIKIRVVKIFKDRVYIKIYEVNKNIYIIIDDDKI